MKEDTEENEQQESGFNKRYTAEQICLIEGINRYNRVVVLKVCKDDKLTRKQWKNKLKELL